MNIDALIDRLLVREGGFVNHPNDKGGPTNYGITIKTLSNYLGRFANIDDVKSLSQDTAREIYKNNYYYSPGINKLPVEIQEFIFDCAVNHGPSRAIKFVQRVCNQAGVLPTLVVDGALGDKSVKAARWAQNEMHQVFLEALIEERANFYKLIVANNPSQEVFIKGWLNRLDEFRQGATA